MTNELNNTNLTESLPLTEEQLDELRSIICESLNRTEKGAVSNKLQNCVTVLRNDPILKGTVRRNLLTGGEDIFGEMPWKRESTRVSDHDISPILLYFETHYDISSEKNILHALDLIAGENGYHPIQEYLNNLVWDGVPRIKEALYHFLGAEKNGINEEFLHIFMHGAAKRIFQPGAKFELMLDLVGGQGAGKSTFLRFLAIKDEWFSDDLKKLDDENIYRKLQGKWILELSEMVATANARSIEDIKSFLSRSCDTYKVPYDRFPEDHPRQCVFAGSSNKMDFLPMDRSGNRRFLPVEIHPEKAEVHILQNEAESRAYIDQMWAEIMAERANGKCKIWLSKEEEDRLMELQKPFMQEDTLSGMIYGFLESFTGPRFCTSMLYKEALHHDDGKPKAWELREIREIVNQGIRSGVLKDWRPYAGTKRYADYSTQRGWERIPQSEQTKLDIPSGYTLVNDEDLPENFPG